MMDHHHMHSLPICHKLANMVYQFVSLLILYISTSIIAMFTRKSMPLVSYRTNEWIMILYETMIPQQGWLILRSVYCKVTTTLLTTLQLTEMEWINKWTNVNNEESQWINEWIESLVYHQINQSSTHILRILLSIFCQIWENYISGIFLKIGKYHQFSARG